MLLSSKIESQLTYKGFQCTIMFTPMGYRCGYVKLTPSDKYFKKTYNQIPLVCHGGITYTRDCLPGQMSEDECWYIGFDCGYSHDGIDLETYEIIYDSDLQLLGNNERDLITSSVVTMANVKAEYPVRTKEFVENELKYIVDQLLSESRSDTITDIIDIFGKMRETSKEENKAIQQALDKISSPTGLNLFDFVKGDDRNF